MLKLTFYVPETHLEQVKEALFSAGAGRIGLYDRCCWQISGQGQFRALEGSQPFLGLQNQIEVVEEFRVEMVLEEENAQAVLKALLESHPYETPAYYFVKTEEILSRQVYT